MENDSPLKSWVRRHSPIRSKPLPPPPDNAALPDSERPFRAISGNASPTKRSSKSKLRAFLRNKPQPPAPPGSSPSAARPRSEDGRGRPAPPSVEASERRSSIRKSLRTRRGSTDLRGLSQRISTLEEQLKQARKELDDVSRNVSTTDFTADGHNHDERQPRRRYRASHGEGRRFEGLVGSLLDQRDQDNNIRGLSCRSTLDLSAAQLENQGFEDALDVREACLSDADMIHHKRKRSEVRQASWERMQNHLKQQQIQQLPPEPKRRRPTSGKSLDNTSPRSKELPELPEFPMPNKRDPSGYVIQGSTEDEEDNGCPPLDRQQVKFSQPSVQPSTSPPNPTKHRRRRSQIIEPEQLREAFGESEVKDGGRTRTDPQASSNSAPRTANPPSPHRRHCTSPSRLDKVEEEYEWDEDIF